MSTVSESKPWCAMISAENELGIDSQPFTTASPRAQIALSVFSLTSISSLERAAPSVRDAYSLRPPLDSPGAGAGCTARVPPPPASRLPRSSELRAAHHPEVAPAADAKLLGLLEVGDRRGVGRRVDEVRLHGADR